MPNLRFVPEFRVKINGEPIPAALRASISSVSHQTGLEGADRVELTLVNENLRWLDHRLLALDRTLALSLGYAPDALEQMFVGEIVSHTASFPSGGSPTLTVAAQDRMKHLEKGTKTRWFAISIPSVGNLPLPDVAVAGMVSLENGLVPIFDPVAAVLSLILGGIEFVAAFGDPNAMQRLIRKQEGESNFEFLSKIAKENNWEMFIDHSGPLGGFKLRFMSSADHLSADLTLKYGQSLIEFNPRISNVGQVVGVRAYFWRPEMKMEFTVEVSWDWDRQALDISVTPGFGLPGGIGTTPEALRAQAAEAETPEARQALEEQSGEVEEQLATAYDEARIELVDQPVTLASAPRAIVSRLLPKLNNRLTGSGSTIGDPRIKAGSVIRLEGVGEQFGGLYRVTSATHTLDSGGYRTSFEVRKEIWFGSIPLPAQGAVPVRVQGQQVA